MAQQAVKALGRQKKPSAGSTLPDATVQLASAAYYNLAVQQERLRTGNGGAGFAQSYRAAIAEAKRGGTVTQEAAWLAAAHAATDEGSSLDEEAQNLFDRSSLFFTATKNGRMPTVRGDQKLVRIRFRTCVDAQLVIFVCHVNRGGHDKTTGIPHDAWYVIRSPGIPDRLIRIFSGAEKNI